MLLEAIFISLELQILCMLDNDVLTSKGCVFETPCIQYIKCMENRLYATKIQFIYAHLCAGIPNLHASFPKLYVVGCKMNCVT